MAENYKKLLKLVAKSNLPSSFAAPPSYDMLLYESFYHFGVALQNLGRHRESVFAYTSAMNAMHLRKVSLPENKRFFVLPLAFLMFFCSQR